MKPTPSKKSDLNRFNYESKDEKFLNTLFQEAYNLEYKKEYKFGDGAKEIHDAVGKKLPPLMIRNRADFNPVKPFNSILVCQNGEPVLKTKVAYQKWDVVTNCFGTLEITDREKEGNQIFFTDFGLMLDATKEGNLWRYVKLSCDPNLRFEQCYVRNGKGHPPSFLCSLVATKDIKVNETLRVDVNQLRGLHAVDYDCACKEDGCVKRFATRHRCMVPACRLKGRGFPSAKGLQKHMEYKHPAPPATNLAQFVTEAQKNLKCPHCEKFLSNSASLSRHVRSQHRENQTKHHCPNCLKEFSRKDGVTKHLEENHCHGITKGKANPQPKGGKDKSESDAAMPEPSVRKNAKKNVKMPTQRKRKEKSFETPADRKRKRVEKLAEKLQAQEESSKQVSVKRRKDEETKSTPKTGKRKAKTENMEEMKSRKKKEVLKGHPKARFWNTADKDSSGDETIIVEQEEDDDFKPTARKFRKDKGDAA